MPNFDELYSVHKNPWGTASIKAIEKFAGKFKPGTVLDIGVGDGGRSVLPLAKLGFVATGIDISPEAIKILQQQAQELGASVTGIVTDIASYQLDRDYDNIMSAYTLHFLRPEDQVRVITMMQENTVVGGTNLIVDFTTDGPLYQPSFSGHWFEYDELKRIYKNWEIISYGEEKVSTRKRDENDQRLQQTAATLFARKK